MALYAHGTKVPATKSQADIQQVLTRFGARSYAAGFNPEGAAVEFEIDDRRYRIMLPFPQPVETNARYEAEIRRRWRSLLLVIKSRLEAAATGISSIEDEFAMNVVLPDGRTAAEHVLPAIEHAYRTGELAPIMGGLTPSASELAEIEAAGRDS